MKQKIYHLVVPVTAIVFPYVIFEWLRMNPSLDVELAMPRGHFYVVSSVSLLATAIAVSLGISGKRLRNIKVSFLSLAFISLAEVFAVHGLSTPHLLMPPSQLPQIAAQLSIMLAVFWIWLSSFSSDHSLVVFLSKHQSHLVPVWMLFLAGWAVWSLWYPHFFENWIPLNHQPLKGGIAGLTVILNLLVIRRYFQSYRYTRFPLQISIVYSAGWLIVSQLILVSGETWRLSWWLYHVLLLASMIVMLTGVLRQFASDKSVGMAVKALFTTDPAERIEACISPSVKALVVATESRDKYTAGHNFRVAVCGLRLAEELGLAPEQTRALAQGAIIHDVGKINIPDHILNKPGKLTPEERKMIERHPVIGYEMCKRLGFMKEELDVIRHHHERWDGKGYPDGLKGTEIPFLARILAVVDVYDALTSERSYRKAWTHEEAMNFILTQRGSHFDPACVDAWVRVCERNPQFYQKSQSFLQEQKSVLQSS